MRYPTRLQKTMISYKVHPEVISSENLIFKDDNHSRKYTSFNEKSTIALCAIGWSYTATNDKEKQRRILIAARKKVHYMNGLPEPTKNLRYIETFISQYYMYNQ